MAKQAIVLNWGIRRFDEKIAKFFFFVNFDVLAPKENEDGVKIDIIFENLFINKK